MKVIFSTANDAFGADDETRNFETARILREIANRVLIGSFARNEKETVRDTNGNTIGHFVVDDR
jgi:hypothetical protein